MCSCIGLIGDRPKSAAIGFDMIYAPNLIRAYLIRLSAYFKIAVFFYDRDCISLLLQNYDTYKPPIYLSILSRIKTFLSSEH